MLLKGICRTAKVHCRLFIRIGGVPQSSFVIVHSVFRITYLCFGSIRVSAFGVISSLALIVFRFFQVICGLPAIAFGFLLIVLRLSLVALGFFEIVVALRRNVDVKGEQYGKKQR